MRPQLLFAALSAVLLSACYSAGDGQAPPLASIYFPTGLALDAVPNGDLQQHEPPRAGHLYVASSDFDLQYNASALASYDLDTLTDLRVMPQNCNVDRDCEKNEKRVRCDNSDAHFNSGPDAQHPVYLPTYFCVEPDPNAPIKPCGLLGEHSAADQLLYPGRCASIDSGHGLDSRDVSNLISSTVQIGAFATDIVFKTTGMGGDSTFPGRLFLPVRGDATLHWVDVDPAGGLHCGQTSGDNSCDLAHRVGDDASTDSPNGLRQEPEPFGIAIDDAGRNIAVTNQTTGSVSLYVNPWSTDSHVTPMLVARLTGLPTAPVGIAALPTPLQLDLTPEPGFLAVYRDAPQVDLLRVHDDDPNGELLPGDPYDVRVLGRAASAPINANSLGFDSRDIVIDDAQRRADYADCLKGKEKECDPKGNQNFPTGQALTDCACPGSSGADLSACKQTLQACLQGVHQPSVFVSNRAPASLLVGAYTADFSYASGSSELPAFTDSVPLSAGPSRVVLGRVKVPSTASDALSDGYGPYELEQRVFVVCFDSRRIYIYDPVRNVIDSIVTTGRGPFALAIDESRGLGYVAHFTDSYLGVISLDQRFPKNYAAIIASVGVPSPPRTSK